MRQTQMKMNGLGCTFIVSGLLFGMIGVIRSSQVASPAGNSEFYPSQTFHGSLYSSSPTFTPGHIPSLSDYYYQAIEITVETSRVYALTSQSTIDTYGYLYNATFDPFYPTTGLLASNDDSGGAQQFLIKFNLQSGRTYILVVTTSSPRTTGFYSVTATDPSSVSMREITRVKTTTRTSGYISSSNPRFTRANGFNSAYHYESIRLVANRSGFYQFRSSSGSNTDLYGCLYSESFNPSSPWANQLICDDDSGDNRQFQFLQNLSARHSYTLVVGSYIAYTTGSYCVSVTGPSSVYMTVITPIDHRLSVGAIAGIASGCLAAGAVLLVVFIVCIRQNRKETPVPPTVIPPQYNLAGQYPLYPVLHQYVGQEAPPPYHIYPST